MEFANHSGEPKDKALEEGCLNPLTNKDTKNGERNHKQDLKKLVGIWQKQKSVRVLVLRVLVGVLLIVIITLAVLLSLRACRNDKDPAYTERSPEETPETKVVEGSTAAQCMDDWVLYRGTCYYFSNKTDTWNNSQNFCKSHDSSLAIIHNKKELNYINLLKSNYWIGLSRTQDDSGWVWTDGTFHSEIKDLNSAKRLSSPKQIRMNRFKIVRTKLDPGEAEHVYYNDEGFKSDSGRYKKKWICSNRFSNHSP
ncbi:C-type lectin domain family 2 member H-like [Lithobates pipiens]